LKLRKRLAIWSYALFIQAGYLKTDPRLSWIPVDLTAIMGVAVGGFLLLELLRSRKIHPRILLVVLFFVSFLPSLMVFSLTPYAEVKTLRFFTQTFLVAVGPFFFVQRTEELKEFCHATVFVGLISVLDVFSQVILYRGAVWRITAFGSSVIALGRSVGFVGVFVGMKILEDGFSILRLGMLLSSILVLIISGQRMGMVGPVLAIIVTLSLVQGVRFAHVRRFATIGLLLAVIVSSVFFMLPERTRIRIEAFFGMGLEVFLSAGNDGRKTALIASLEESTTQPIGVGLGGFQNPQLLVWKYPHNIIAEIFLEGGWLAGVAFLISFGGTLFILLSLARTDQIYRQCLGLFLFAFFYALVAGDINDNRALFAYMGAALATGRIETRDVAKVGNPSSTGHYEA